MASNINDMTNDNQSIGRLLDGRYQVLQTIGYGAFADVYLVKFNNTE
jgi:serine/threonine protein kinase